MEGNLLAVGKFGKFAAYVIKLLVEENLVNISILRLKIIW